MLSNECVKRRRMIQEIRKMVDDGRAVNLRTEQLEEIYNILIQPQDTETDREIARIESQLAVEGYGSVSTRDERVAEIFRRNRFPVQKAADQDLWFISAP